MANPAKFGHDQLGHLLSDKLLTIPRFQRSYSWTTQNVSEFWNDVQRSRPSGGSYFMGTVVLAEDQEMQGRMLIVDGQQRITTTAILLIAIRDRLRELNRDEQWRAVEREYLSDYVLEQEAHKPKLMLSPGDTPAFEALLGQSIADCPSGLIRSCYEYLKEQIDKVAPDAGSYFELISIVTYLNTNVQVLTAVASGLSEAFVIFETLNDRGADLTTADLLKNYLFSQAGELAIRQVEEAWVRVSGAFDKPADFVKFIRYEHMSRLGHVTVRGLYKALQADIGEGSIGAKAYVGHLEEALRIYLALRDPEDRFWSANSVSVRDSLLAFRRLGLEVNSTLLLAAFNSWGHTEATRLVNTVANWSVRAWLAGNLGGGAADDAFCGAAVALSSRTATHPEDLKEFMIPLVPDDSAFRQVVIDSGRLNTTRAKYLLSQIEKQYRIEVGENVDAMPDWTSRSVTVEHLFAKSSSREAFATAGDYEQFQVLCDRLPNLTLLETSLNASLEDKPFSEKQATYRESAFRLTSELSSVSDWSFACAERRAGLLADLAVRAWPL